MKVQLRSFYGSTIRPFITNKIELRSFHGFTNVLLISLFKIFTSFACFCTYRSRTGANLESIAPEQSNLKTIWKTAKILKKCVKSQYQEFLQLKYNTKLLDSMKPTSLNVSVLVPLAKNKFLH